MTSYNAKDCSVTFNGVPLTGFAEEMVNGAKDEDFFSTSWGAQGDCAMSEINNTQGTISMTFKGNSASLGYLIQEAKAGTIAPLWVNNLKRGRKFGGDKARIKNLPEIVEAQELEDVSVEFAVIDYTAE